jgi:poly-gamma-glutamate synthesis protein (capsule biosynthesis protein)
MTSNRREFLQSSAAFALAGAASRFALGASRPITLAAVGDCMITRRLSILDSPAFLDLLKVLRSADVAFGNFEMTLAESDAPPAYHEGCAYVHLRADSPDNRFIADELKWAGFRLMGLANNHSLDFGAQGMFATIQKFDRAGLAHAGTGADLAEARAPGYFDTSRGRVALVACASTFPDYTQAADGNGEVAGRPGLNPVRLRTSYRVTPGELESLRAVAATIGAPAAATKTPSNELRFLNRLFVAGSPTGPDVSADPDDANALGTSIRRASRNSDLTLMGMHAHEADGRPDVPSRFLQPFAHSMIDAGADAFIGHGPHVLRGIEIYKNKPIFYSLGNFIFHGESARQIPSEIYRECKVAGNDPSDVFDKVLGGFSATPYWQSVVPVATFENRKLTALRLYPVTLNPNLSRSMRGTPELAQGEEARQIIATIARLSEPFRTTIRFDSGVGTAVV